MPTQTTDPEPQATGAADAEALDAEADSYVDPLVEQGLQASTSVFEQAQALLKSSRENHAVGVPRTELKGIRKQALAMNRAFTRYVKAANLRENRLLVEIHLLRQASYRDGIDRDANRARVYEFLRRYRLDDDRPAPSSASLPSTNPLHAPSLAATQVDKAMSTVVRIEAAIAQLSPTGTVQMHGAGLLTARAR
tara:strand:- start:131 stop:712 length:582 start_codon:yes stop_codon:yes gene_type:complete